MTGAYIPNTNEFIFKNGIVYCYTNDEVEFIIDEFDYMKVKDYCWRLSSSGYIITNIRISDNERYSVELHRLIYNNYPFDRSKKNYVVDHIDRNKLNNRRSNFREVSTQNNSFNAVKPKNNTSGFIGVSYAKSKDRWIAYIKKDYKRIYLGGFKNKEDAIVARLRGELKYFGVNFSPQRHLFEEYGVREDKTEESYS